MRHSRVLGAGDHPVQRPQQGRRLVGPRHSHLRNAGRLSALLRRQPVRHLREDPGRQNRLAPSYGSHRQGFSQETPGPGSHQTARQYEGLIFWFYCFLDPFLKRK